MVIAVRTERGATGLEVVKVADDESGRARLAREAQVLRRAAHPGIVEVVGTTESTLRLRHGGTPLARLGAIAPDHAAALVRAVADIVDSMHQQGLVHRRIDADHVVVNERGRPNLCGFGEAGAGDAVEQADDVAALGRLLDRLLDGSADALWSPAHRGVRSAPRRKRAMAAFRTATAAAQRESAGQRLTARQFAAAIGDALPGLSLPTPPGGGAHATGDHADIDPTADIGWSDLDLSMLAIDDDFDAVAADPNVRTDPYARLADLAGPDPGSEVGGGDEGRDQPPPAVGGVRTRHGEIDWSDLEHDAQDRDRSASTGRGIDDSGQNRPAGEVRDDVGDAAAREHDLSQRADEPDPIVDALRAALESEETESRSPGVDAATAGSQTRLVAPTPSDGDRPTAPLSIEIRTGTAEESDDVEDRPRPNRRVLGLVAAALLVVGVVIGSLVARAVDPFGADTTPATDDPEVTTTTEATDAAPLPTPPPPPPECEVVEIPGPDADDDGCPDEVTIDGRVATIGDVEVELGQDGDLVSFADTDCDGIMTPVLLRPTTDEVFAFDEWSLSEAVEIDSIGRVDDAVDIERGPEPCSPAVVFDGSGTETEVPAT